MSTDPNLSVAPSVTPESLCPEFMQVLATGLGRLQSARVAGPPPDPSQSS